jgi:isopenicillin-N epimerase
VNKRTRVIFLSHITSATALKLPVKEVCTRAREEGILTIIDGAHAPGQLDLNLELLGADIYTGACHKWLCGPKGSAFLYARPEMQARLDPLVVSWGWEPDNPGPSPFIDKHEWQGTRDLAAFLTTPAAIAFQRDHNWTAIRERCHQMAQGLHASLCSEYGMQTLDDAGVRASMQMFSVQLPELDPAELQRTLLEEYHIEVVAQRWQDRPLLRVSVQAYNDTADVQALLNALGEQLP